MISPPDNKARSAGPPTGSWSGPLVLSASPRSGGNCDAAARLFAGELSRAGHSPALVYLRDYHVLPCVACDACGRLAAGLTANVAQAAAARPAASVEEPDLAGQVAAQPHGGTSGGPGFAPADLRRGIRGGPPFGCPLARKDDSADLLLALATSPAVCFVAPIYFYHLPAAFKALLDRLQAFWSFEQHGLGLFAGAGPRLCRAVLIGARPRGDRLFEGSLLSLKYALAPLKLELANAVTLHGLDKPGDLEADSRAVSELHDSAARFVAALAGRGRG